MKNIFLTWVMGAICVASMTACGNSSSSEQPATTATEQEETTTGSTANQATQMAYICPMKCEGSASMQPGKCPKCGMDLEKNPDFQASAADSTVTL